MGIHARRTTSGLLALILALVGSSSARAQDLDGNIEDLVPDPANRNRPEFTMVDAELFDDDPLSQSLLQQICNEDGLIVEFLPTSGNLFTLSDAERAIVEMVIMEWKALLPGQGPIRIRFAFDRSFAGLRPLAQTDVTVTSGSGLPVMSTVRFNKNVKDAGLFHFDAGPPSADLRDFLSTVRHEVCHAIGFAAFAGAQPTRFGSFINPASGEFQNCDGVAATFDMQDTFSHLVPANTADPNDPANDLMVSNLPRGVRRPISTLDVDLLNCAFDSRRVAPECSPSGFNVGLARGRFFPRVRQGALFIGIDLNQNNPFDIDGKKGHLQLRDRAILLGLTDSGPEKYTVSIDFGNDGVIGGGVGRNFDLIFELVSDGGVLPAPPRGFDDGSGTGLRIIDNRVEVDEKIIEFAFGNQFPPDQSPLGDIEFRIRSLRIQNFLSRGQSEGVDYGLLYNIFIRVDARADGDGSNPDTVEGEFNLDALFPPDLLELTSLVSCAVNRRPPADVIGQNDEPSEFDLPDLLESIVALPGAAYFRTIVVDNASPSQNTIMDITVVDSERGVVTGDLFPGGNSLFEGGRVVASFLDTATVDRTFRTTATAPLVAGGEDTTTVNVVFPRVRCFLGFGTQGRRYPLDLIVTHTVQNSGETELENLVLDSPELELLGFVPPPPFGLAPGETRRFPFVIRLESAADCDVVSGTTGSPSRALRATASVVGQVRVVDGFPCVIGDGPDPGTDIGADEKVAAFVQQDSYEILIPLICSDAPIPTLSELGLLMAAGLLGLALWRRRALL